MRQELYPLLFTPIYKEKIWGGRLLGEMLEREVPPGPIGESWEVADHCRGASEVSCGTLAGFTLRELIDLYGPSLLGRAGENLDRFPLLFKYIAAAQKLSLQVHPDNHYASQVKKGAWGKAEMWYILHSEQGAWIIWGLRPGTGKDQLSSALSGDSQALHACLNKVAVQPGQLYPISPGLVHALGPGVGVAEIQQNSDLTYRLFDWDRVDEKGRARALHQERALAVIDFSPEVLSLRYQLRRCREYFRFGVVDKQGPLHLHSKGRFRLITPLRAQLCLSWGNSEICVPKRQTCLIPAALGAFTLRSGGPFLEVTLP